MATRTKQEVLNIMKQHIVNVSKQMTEMRNDGSVVADMLNGLELALDNGSRRLGACWFFGNKATKISLAWKWMRDCPQDVLDDTMLHEIAHAIAGREASHGPLWQRVCKIIGAQPNQYHQGKWRPARKYTHICDKCGEECGASDRRWRRGVTYTHNHCGGNVTQVETAKMKKVRITTDSPEPQPKPPAEAPKPTPRRKTASEASKSSKAKAKAKNPELYARIQSLASKASRLKKDPSKHGELFLVKEELKKLRAEFAAL